MSTNATIAVQREDGSVRSIYLHWDGYESHAMPLLTGFHYTQERAEALIALGGLSVLDKSIECPDGHTFEEPVRGYCIAYARDRGEDLEIDGYDTLAEFEADLYQNTYLFADGSWKVWE